MENYFSVGEISKITKIPISTLRYYDSEEVLSPTFRNERTGYRYYSGYQIPILKAISHMRRLGFSIKHIKSHLNTMDYNHTLELFKDIIEETKGEIERLEGIKRELENNLKDFEEVKGIEKRLGIPFFKKSPQVDGVKFSGPFKSKKETVDTMKMMDNFEFSNNIHFKSRGFKFLKKQWDQNRDLKEELFAIAEETNFNNALLNEEGTYACMYGRGAYEKQNYIDELCSWIESEGYEVKGEIYIFFKEKFIFFINKNEFIYLLKIPVKERIKEE